MHHYLVNKHIYAKSREEWCLVFLENQKVEDSNRYCEYRALRNASEDLDFHLYYHLGLPNRLFLRQIVFREGVYQYHNFVFRIVFALRKLLFQERTFADAHK